MTKETAIQIFAQNQIRDHWDDDVEKWYFSIVDVITILTENVIPHGCWRNLKQRLIVEGNITLTNCHGLKMVAAVGKMRMTDVANPSGPRAF